MSKFLFTINRMSVFVLAAVLLAAAWSPVAEAALRKVNCGKEDLQKVINLSVNGDTIELTGICLGNFRIDGKDLTLVGASTPGPHGITGVATDSTALVISRSNNTQIQKLSISNGAWNGVAASDSFVSMSGCVLSNNARNGILATNGSRVDCLECDFTGNLRFAAVSNANSLVTLLDSIVTGRRGLSSSNYSYIDIDCASYTTTHPCSLTADLIAGQTFTESTLAFYGAGNFWGQVVANDRSEAQLLGASQQSTGQVNPPTNVTPRSNSISGGASLQVAPYDDGVAPPLASRLVGITNVSGFSHALLYGEGGSTVLDGSLNCDSAGDAWKDAFVVLAAGASITGCEHAP